VTSKNNLDLRILLQPDNSLTMQLFWHVSIYETAYCILQPKLEPVFHNIRWYN